MSESFTWNHPDLNYTSFHALANLLSLRNGGQVEPASYLEEATKNDCDDEWGTASVDTRRADKISDSGHDRLRRKFLDCLAEFAANRKDARSVACTAMKENEDSVTLWIARNEGFSKVEEPVFDRLGELLSGSSYSKDGEDIKDSLWSEMLSYHQSRIQRDHIPNLRASFKSINTTRSSDLITTYNKLSKLRKLVLEIESPNQSTKDIHSRLVMTAYELRITKSAEEALNSSSSAISKTKKLWIDICLLARLRVAFQKFSEIAMKLPSFSNATIVLLPRGPAPTKPPERPLSLKQTFGILNLNLDSESVKNVIGQKWALSKAGHEFAKLQRQKMNIHAEVQMLLYLSRSERPNSAVLPYFGCSKLGCFMCFHLLQAYGKFSMRGSHGRLFKPWTVPETQILAIYEANRLVGAVKQLQSDVKKEVMALIGANLRREKTSVIGGSSIVSDYRDEASRRRSDIERMRLKAEQERVAEMFTRLSLEENRSNMGQTSYKHTQGQEYLDQCSSCGGMTSRRCSFCNRDSYCSKACEEKRSGSHLFKCTKRPLTSADYLYDSLGDDLLPDNEDVLEDFGFDQLISFSDKSKLFGLYRGLYLSDKVSVDDIHKWQVEGTLVANIKEFYYQIPEKYRGGYFPWFLKHTHILDKRVAKEEATKNHIATFFDQAREYLDEGDRHNHFRELQPEAKSHCYVLLAEVLHAMSPGTTEYLWKTFGFCTCRNEREESWLGGIYQRLLIGNKLLDYIPQHLLPRLERNLQPATFKEFWQAYQNGTLIQLIDSKGLKSFRVSLPHLESFLSVPYNAPRPSVWDLKQFLAINDPAEFPPVPSVYADYGFMNCSTFEETCTLMEIYKRLLQKADPLELHKACIAGKLFEFGQGFHVMDEGYRRWMWNVYPLKVLEN